MPKLACAVVVMVLAAGVAGCGGRKSPYCPKGMSEIATRSEVGKSVYCETSDRVRAQWIELYPTAPRPRQSCGYYNGKPEGSFTAWHADGKSWVQGQYADGLKTGKWKQWDNAGNMVAEGDYRTGRLIAGAPVAGIASCERVAGSPPR